MKLAIALILAASFCWGQQAQIQSAQANLAQAQSQLTIALSVVPTPDPTVAMNQAAGLYAAMLLCTQMPGCVPVAFLYSCPAPAPWTANTTYLFGQKVSDSTGNVYTLTGISNPTGAESATTPPAGQAIFTDGPYSWTLSIAAGVASVCVAPGTQALTVAK